MNKVIAYIGSFQLLLFALLIFILGPADVASFQAVVLATLAVLVLGLVA